MNLQKPDENSQNEDQKIKRVEDTESKLQSLESRAPILSRSVRSASIVFWVRRVISSGE